MKLPEGGDNLRPSLADAAVPPAHMGSWRVAGELRTARSRHSATLLADGRVLVSGGHIGTGLLTASATAGGPNGASVAGAEIFDWATGTSMSSAAVYGHAAHQAVALSDGSVLVPAMECSGIYCPVTGSWRAAGGLNCARVDYTATALDDGRVLVAGGLDEFSGVPIVTAEVYSPATGTWSITETMRLGRLGHSSVRLTDGTVLVTGGVTLAGCEIETASGAELYYPATGTWHPAGLMTHPRFCHTATLLDDGNVLVAGGCELARHIEESLPSEIYDTSAGTWKTGSMLLGPRAEHTATRLRDGRVLIAGGVTKDADATTSTEIYDPATGRWSAAPPLVDARRSHTATILPSGDVLIIGGETVDADGNGRPLATAEIFEI